MAERQTAERTPDGGDNPTLDDLFADAGRTAGPRVAEFAQVAAGVQRRRYDDGVSDTPLVTRSTALWTLMSLDRDIAAVFAGAGVDREALGKVLFVRSASGAPAKEPARAHPEFARAVRTYLSAQTDPRPVGLVDLAVAITDAVRGGDSGLLPGRLKQLSVDYDAVARGLRRLAGSGADGSGSAEPPAGLDLAAFSGSVRGMRRRLGADTAVTAGEIGRELQRAHPEYGRGAFARVTFGSPDGPSAPVDDWLGRVGRLYDRQRVAASRHQVIDGELVLLALAELDAGIATDLGAGGFLAQIRQAVDVRPRSATTYRTEWTQDDPADNDLLGRLPLAEALVGRLKLLADRGDRSASSFLIHVDGPWGAGKSTLFRFLRDQLRRHDFLAVEINAWREQRIGLPWWTIFSALRSAVTSGDRWTRRPGTWATDLANRVRAGLMPFTAAMLVLGATAIVAVLLADLDLAASGKAADSALKVVSLLSAATAGVIAIGKYLLPGSRKTAQALVDASDNPMREVQRLFSGAFRRARRPVVFLVDDLDRCDADYVVEFLEVMQTVVRRAGDGRTPGPYAFVAADGQWIRSSYQKRYESFMPGTWAGRPLGYLFLEKVFQIHVRLPAITSGTRESFLTAILEDRLRPATPPADAAVSKARAAVRDAESGAQLAAAVREAGRIRNSGARMEVLGQAAIKVSQREIHEAARHKLRDYAGYLEPNPRSMILYVNTYGILQTLRILEERYVDEDPLALWTVIEIRWPHLADHLRANPKAVEARRDGTEPRDEVERLLGDDEVRQILDDARWGGPVTADVVRRYAGA